MDYLSVKKDFFLIIDKHEKTSLGFKYWITRTLKRFVNEKTHILRTFLSTMK